MSREFEVGRHAVVIGASLSGLLAARVLADSFGRVTVIERGPLPDAREPLHRSSRACPAHLWLRRGIDVIEGLFPGIEAEMPSCGVVADLADELCWFHWGAYKARFHSGISAFLGDTAELERRLRRRLRFFPNITFRPELEVAALYGSTDGRAVIGAKLRGKERIDGVATELILDASGRDSRAPRFLAELGFPTPKVSEVRVDVAFASRLYRMPAAEPRDWKALAVFATPPHGRRMGILYPVDERRMVATLGGWCGDHPPVDEEGFQAFADNLPVSTVGTLLRRAEPLSSIVLGKFPSNVWRHYEALRRFPQGFGVLGGAVASLNPLYGQGMSLAALEATTLAAELARLRRFRMPIAADPGFSRRLQKGVARIAAVLWLLATLEDGRYPGSRGKSFPGQRLLGWYSAQILELSAARADICRSFLAVTSLLEGPASLLRPQVLGLVLAQVLRRHASSWADDWRRRAPEAA